MVKRCANELEAWTADYVRIRRRETYQPSNKGVV
jgi:hypothetical protein